MDNNTVNDEAGTMLYRIRESIAIQVYDSLLEVAGEVVEKSRHNKGGSMTVPKSLTEDLKNLVDQKFFDLGKQEKQLYYQVADDIIDDIKIILGV